MGKFSKMKKEWATFAFDLVLALYLFPLVKSKGENEKQKVHFFEFFIEALKNIQLDLFCSSFLEWNLN